MRNIIQIIRGDVGHIFHSVVALILIMGLCIVPCLYAWFNIFSNWDPYGTDATSRIRVAVASGDEGASVFGVELNAGKKMMEALESNSQIGWVLVDSWDEAMDLVESDDCYAALYVPPDFSRSIISFLDLEFDHPVLEYYENGKKNAIAPKITSQAKNSVVQQVDVVFLQTLLSYVWEVAAVLQDSGLDAEATLQNLSDTIADLGDKLDDCNVTLHSLVNLTAACQSLLYASGNLVGDVSISLGLTVDLAENIHTELDDLGTSVQSLVSAILSSLQGVGNNLGVVYTDLATALTDGSVYNQFVESDLLSRAELLRSMQQLSLDVADAADGIGLVSLGWLMRQAAGDLGSAASLLESLTPVDPEDNEAWAAVRERVLQVMEHLNAARTAVNGALQVADEAVGVAIGTAFSVTGNAIEDAEGLIAALQGKASGTAGNLYDLAGSLGTLESGLLTTMNALNTARQELYELSDFIDALAHSAFLQDVLTLMNEGAEALEGRLVSPLQVSTVVFYPADGSYGSQMSPFYTMLAQWVGALFSAVLLKTTAPQERAPKKLKMHQRYFGRLALFLTVGILQALITSVGDLLYVGIYCEHPWLFILASVVSGLCFTIINYSLVFTLGAAGLAVSVIVMVIQVAGSGGTYPVEVVPEIFQTLYPFMPFKFGMNAMREAVSGLYGTLYWDNLLILAAIALGMIPISFLIYRPGNWLNGLLEKGKRASGIMT